MSSTLNPYLSFRDGARDAHRSAAAVVRAATAASSTSLIALVVLAQGG